MTLVPFYCEIFVLIISGKSVITTSFPNKVINPVAINILLRVIDKNATLAGFLIEL